ncbi:peroxiredoxin [Sphingomonas sp. DBB INV C78]|uniref:OsmC family protein n=1 Tax=Sphingomonas sp. DBB INV C78 TaxID=3349434 RepID=UPI0036D27C6E
MIVVERIAPDGTAHRISIGLHEIVADLTPPEGEGPDPHDLYDAALGACKALTMLWYAQRNGIPLEDIHVGVSRDASEERQGVYRLKTRIALGGPLSDEQHDKLVGVAGKCPIHKLMTEVRTEIETIAVDRRDPEL